MKAIKSIRLERAEGPTPLPNPVTVGSYEHASLVLSQWARTAPEGGGYDKTDFRVEWEDGEVYEGRVDLMREHSRGYDLRRHMRDFCAFYAGRRKPAHLTEGQYQRILAEYPDEHRAQYERVLTTYLAEDAR